MHATARILIGMVTFAAANGGFSAEPIPAGSPPAVPPVSAATAPFSRNRLLETWGWMLAQEKGLAGMDILGPELVSFFNGFRTNLCGGAPIRDPREVFPNLQRLMQNRRARLVQATIRKNEAEAGAFFNLLKKSTNVVELPSGLCYEILRPGQGPKPQPAQTIVVHYFGRRIDGSEFAEFGPLDSILVTNHMVCRGWVDAMRHFHAGTKLKLYVPPPLSEREAEAIGVEPGSALVFDVELLSVKDTAPEDLANATLPAPPESEPPYVADITDRQLMEVWGWVIAQQTGAASFGLNRAEVDALAKGVGMGIKSQAPPTDLGAAEPQVERFVTEQREKVRTALRQKQLAAANAFFAGLKTNESIVTLPSGLRYEIVKPGDGPNPRPGEMVIVDFTARLIDGTVFDRTDNEPLHIEVGSVTRGFNEGIQRINKGGRIKLYIPADLGFGEVPASGGVAAIPPGSALIYDIELKDIERSAEKLEKP